MSRAQLDPDQDRRTLSGRNKAVPDSEFDERRYVGDAELLHQPAAVGFDALGGEVDDHGDLSARSAFSDER